MVLAQASPGKPMRVATDTHQSLEGFRERANALIEAELTVKDMGLFLIAG